MMQVASMPLGLVSILIYHSTHSTKLPFFQKVKAVIVIVNIAHSIAKNWVRAYAQDFEQTPLPTFASKWCAKRGVFMGAYGKNVSIKCIHAKIGRQEHVFIQAFEKFSWPSHHF